MNATNTSPAPAQSLLASRASYDSLVMESVGKTLDLKSEKLTVLQDISLRIEPGEFVAIRNGLHDDFSDLDVVEAAVPPAPPVPWAPEDWTRKFAL